MAKFTKRLTAPSATDKNFIHYSKGGLNTCIMINKTTGYVLPNCVGYAHGRLLEILGAKAVNWKLPACNAEDWYAKAQENGFKVGQTPKLGAVICWRAGNVKNESDGAGHVAIVEEIKSNGDIVTSNSAWNGTNFYTQTLTKASGYCYSSNRPLLGFIYCGIEFDNDTTPITPTPTYVGYLDTAANNSITGWAWNSINDTALKIDIKIYKGSTLVKTITTTANVYREDLLKAKKGNGKHGFVVSFNFNTLGAGTYTVKAYTNNVQLLKTKTVTVAASTTISTTSTTTIKENDVVKIASNAVWYSGKPIPSWVKRKHWIVMEVEGNRAVVDKSTDGKNAIESAIDVKYLIKV